jgi:hypothetical protein
VLKWLTDLFGRKKKVSYDICVNIIESTPRVKIRQETAPLPPPPKKQETIKGITMNADDLRNIWLVVVDTTGLDKATRNYNESNPDESGDGVIDARKLGPLGIKTFAFVNAPDLNAAKGIFWRTLGAKNPRIRGMLAEVARATRVTNFSQIFPILTKTGIVWNYVAGPKESLPGQQSALARQKDLVGKDQYGNESAREFEPAVPQIPDGVQTKVDQRDLGHLDAADRKVLNGQQNNQNPGTPAMPGNMSQEQMMQMMQMMMATMMQNGGKMPAAPEPAKVTEARTFDQLSAEDMDAINSTITPLSRDESDPDLQKQIQAFKNKGSKEINMDTIEDDSIDPQEMANMAKMTQLINPQNPEQAAVKKKKRVVDSDA